jgi:DNA-binding transcriptional ArsR family regulator
MPIAMRQQFVYHRNMNAEWNAQAHADLAASRIAAAIGDPARARMLYCLVDGHARTSTELGVVAGVGPSTASAHLNRLKTERLVQVNAQGKHRYYSLQNPNIAAVLEALSVLAGAPRDKFVPKTPSGLRFARTCYDHIAGALGVALHDRFTRLGWLVASASGGDSAYELTGKGAKALEGLGFDLCETRKLRRRFAFACVDWSERRPHVGGALGAALLSFTLKRRWVVQELDSRALQLTAPGRRGMLSCFGLQL